MRCETHHRKLFEQHARVAGAAGHDRGGISQALELGQNLRHMRQNFHPLGGINFRHKVGKRQLREITLHMLRSAEHAIVTLDGLPVTLVRKRGRMTEIVERFFRREIERPVNIDQRAVEVEEHRLEFEFRQKLFPAPIESSAMASTFEPPICGLSSAMVIRFLFQSHGEAAFRRAMEFEERIGRGAREGAEREDRRVGRIKRIRRFEVRDLDEGRQVRADLPTRDQRLATKFFRRKFFAIGPKPHLQIRI